MTDDERQKNIRVMLKDSFEGAPNKADWILVAADLIEGYASAKILRDLAQRFDRLASKKERVGK